MVLMKPGHEVPTEFTTAGISTTFPAMSVIVLVAAVLDCDEELEADCEDASVAEDELAELHPKSKPMLSMSASANSGSFFIGPSRLNNLCLCPSSGLTGF